MKLILSGYGTMGKVVEELAIEKGHQIVGVFSTINIENCPYQIISDAERLANADAIIDFSHPNNTKRLLEGAKIHKLPIIVATTGARDQLQNLMNQASQYCPIFFSANMSYGVHVFTQALKYLTPLLSESFDIEIIERHHNKKIDAPSGTAIKLLEAIQEIDSSFIPIYDRSQTEHKRDKKEIGMSSIRGGTIVGEHEVLFAGTDEVIEITHRAQSKRIFADGSIKAAQKIKDFSAGFYTFSNL
ncbi:4-hydroxy-tetrahydrodipicolinate reductase [Peptostreptococcus equinus]|uniref:4-hydroxy-tetrahydrodipicolinate reductase n=1 Tax=Peptostreptococcus equinus TaxID=3003601 RepID=A0ABY7JRY3_9FIRM|nr:4-hydroxy-tetrahydrodipicolinate reductase [Peptostreptococcus sp. CBA3647]WAW14702.1 4-hydroxy-tetrahydrodipicolinate reductase [Peptostreptococcus sp. CBA3647]